MGCKHCISWVIVLFSLLPCEILQKAHVGILFLLMPLKGFLKGASVSIPKMVSRFPDPAVFFAVFQKVSKSCVLLKLVALEEPSPNVCLGV